MSGQEENGAFAIRNNVAVPGRCDPYSAGPMVGYGMAPTGESSSPYSRAPEQPPRQKRPAKARSKPESVTTPEARAAFRAAWSEARAAAAELLQATKEDDPMGRVIAADDLEQALAKLWAQRSGRDVNWQGILNHAQGMLKELFAEYRMEALSPEQGAVIREIVENYLGPATKSTGDLSEVIRLIADAGCDPFYAISGDPDVEQE
jgi:hypothetical protein